MRKTNPTALLAILSLVSSTLQVRGATFDVNITVDAGKPIGKLQPIWRFFGADEPNYAYMKDGKRLLGELGEIEPRQSYFRTHNLLTTGDGTPAYKWGSTNAYTEDASGKSVYDWTIVDRIFDAYAAAHVKPYVQIGFMPEAMSVKPEPYRHHWKPGDKYGTIETGWAYPPKDYGKWGELVFQWTKHCVENYGKEEVEKWYWECWNEANIGYWHGTPEEFLHLHDVAIDAVRRALPSARVGGCDSAGSGGKFMQAFLEHCLRGTNYATGKTGTPIDFISFHAKGKPAFVDGHVRMGIAEQLKTIDAGFGMIASYPELKQKPIVIGESDPDGCAACQGPQLGYRNGTMYSSYTAAAFARKFMLADKHGVNLEGALTWAFEFEDEPYFAGFRVLASNGVDLPVLNVFRMFGKMSGGGADGGGSLRVAVTSSAEVPMGKIMSDGVRGEADVAALASMDSNRLSILVWHYHDDDLPGPDAAVDLTITGLPGGGLRATRYLIDRDHSNAFEQWKKLGSPAKPTEEQYKQMEAAGKLAMVEPPALPVKSGKTSVKFDLARQGVTLLLIER
jgi:xylan 1,4-beta-xylosidase